MTADVIQVLDIPLELEEGDVWRCLGGDVVPALAEEVALGLTLGLTLARPAALYRRLSLSEIRGSRVSFEGGLSVEGQFLAHCFQGADEAAFIVATIGPDLENRTRELFAEGKDVEAFVLDAVGSAAVMNTFSQVINRVFKEVTDQGWQTGMCLRPGQSYWDITGQKAVFQAVPAEEIKMHLLESCFMFPQKSQSAVIPLGSRLKMQSDPNESHCRHCQVARCPMREKA